MSAQVMAQINSFLAALVLLSAFAMLSQRKINSLVTLFAWQGFFLSVNTAVVGFAAAKHHLYISSLLTLSLKVILLPYILHVLIVRLKIKKEMETIVNIPIMMLTGIALVIFSYHLTAPVRELSTTLTTRSTLAVALATVMIGLLMMITRKHAVTQIIGFLAMENGLFFAATSATYGMPLVVELGVALDVLIAAFIFGIFFFQISTTFDSLSVEQMENLREDN